MNMNFGNLIKARRKEKNLTLAQVAGLTGLSAGYLSMLERNKISPTIENLSRVCAVLDMTMTDLIYDACSAKNIVSKSDRRIGIFETATYKYEAAFDGTRDLNFLIMTIGDNLRHASNTHPVDEVGYVAAGSIVITVNDTDYSLEAGDSIYIEANSNHSYQKTGEDPCVCVWCYAMSDRHSFHDLVNHMKAQD